MATEATTQQPPDLFSDPEVRHKIRWWISAAAATVLLASVALDGWYYYTLPLSERVHAAAHTMLRSSGPTGMRLGILGALLFFLLYIYAIRKRWPWLRKFGNTAHWLDFHILIGVAAPLLIAFHSTFRFHGIAGMAFWIMWAVVLSGVAGRYIYRQIPRRLNAAEMTLKEIENTRDELAARVERQQILAGTEWLRVVTLPKHEAVQSMSVYQALWTMLLLDLRRPFQVAGLRRQSMPSLMKIASLGGLLPFGNRDIENVISAIRRQSWLSAKILFLEKTQQVFHLWHVVHKPFSYSFAVLVLVHIGFVFTLGYF
jgi:hypothetical protein